MGSQQTLHHLAALQNDDGSFASYSSPVPDSFPTDNPQRTVFFTACVLLALAELPNSALVARIKKKGFSFLAKQKSQHWTWNYWQRESERAKVHPYPDDLDDTFLALVALQSLQPSVLDGSALVAVTKVLCALEVAPGGPYTTWVVSPEATATWRDVDVAVNANIAYFLQSQRISLPGLTKFLHEAMAAGTVVSRYYPSPLPVLYYLSRVESIDAKLICDAVLSLSHPEGHWGNQLDTALAVSALARKGYQGVEEPREYLKQALEKSLHITSFCLDPAEQKKTSYGGSPAFVLAASLEALALSEPKEKKVSHTYDSLRVMARETVAARLASVSPDIAKPILGFAQKIMALDSTIPLVSLPAVTADSIGFTLSQTDAVRLGLANLYGWIGYTIADDVVDGDGNVAYLPAGVWALREMQDIFSTFFPGDTGWRDFLVKTMDSLDSANAWEQSAAHIKFGKKCMLTLQALPDYGNFHALANRSIGHMLPAVATLHRAGYAIDGAEITALAAFFRNFLIARQLNDDAHDWQEDLQAGRLTAVVTLLLTRYVAAEKKTVLREKWDTLLPKLRQYYWQTVIQEVCQHIEVYLGSAAAALGTCAAVKHPEAFLHMLQPLQKAVAAVHDERERTLRFIKEYRGDISTLDSNNQQI